MSTNTVRYLATALAAATALLTVRATDYYVSMTGDDNAENAGTQQAPFATIDCAVTNATEIADIIHVDAGTYTTTTQWGPNLKAKLIGEGATRDEVVIKSAGTYRTLRMASGSWLENVTVEGIGSFTSNADKGGSVELNGGTITNCVVRNGHSNYNGGNSGGNIYMSAGLVVDCVVTNGNAKSRGGNIDCHGGMVSGCTILDGSATAWGGNVYIKGANSVVTNCVISRGRNTDENASNAWGGNVRIEDTGLVVDCTISDGYSLVNGGNVFMNGGEIRKCTISGGTSISGGGNIRLNGSCTVADCMIQDGITTSTSDNVLGANVNMDSSSKLVRCTILGGRTGASNRGSICMNSTGSIENCLVGGSNCGGIILYSADMGVYNSTIVNNSGYGIWSWKQSQVGFLNNIVYGNTSNEWNGNLPDSSSLKGCATSSQSRIKSSAYSEVTEISDSAFVDYANGMYSPALGSALVDAGYPDPREDKSTTDLRGNARINGTAVDIGCYELKCVCVNKNTTGAVEPYDTPETALATIQEALAVADATVIQVYPGTYTTTSQMTISNPVLIRGVPSGSDEVIVKNISTATGSNPYCRVFELNNSEVKIENLVLENGQVYNQNGGNLRIAAGVASKCVIRGGRVSPNPNVDNSLASGAGVEVSGKGVLMHCVVTNNAVNGTAKESNYAYAGGAVFVPNGASAKISNCLIAYNSYEPSIPDVHGTAGIRYGGKNEHAVIENVTIASNVVIGTIADASAGMYCTSWSTRVSNCVFAGNYVTGSGSFSAGYFEPEGHMSVVNCAMDVVDSVYSSHIVSGTPDDFFKNFANGDFRPRTGGKLYNKGATPSISTSVDLLGNPRAFGGSIDIGCYESQVLPGVMMLFF